MKSNEIVLEITEKHFSCRLDLHGIIRITILQSNESGSIEDVHKLLGHLHVLTIDRPRPVLADLRNIKYLPLGTLKAVYRSNMEFIRVSATALVIGSSISKLIASFFVGIQRPPFPIELFQCEESALQWLSSLMPYKE